jgi:predicted ester cyclase
MGIPPTGRSVSVSAVHLFRIEGGKIAEQWVVWDTLGFMQQIGVIPEQAGG